MVEDTVSDLGMWTVIALVIAGLLLAVVLSLWTDRRNNRRGRRR